MSTSTPGPLAADASLHLLVDHLAGALANGDLEPSLLHVGGIDGSGFDLGMRALGGAHPTDELLGFSAPGDWHAVGVATHGWAYHVDDRERPDRDRSRVHVATLVSRSGEVAHRTRIDGDPTLSRQLDDGAPGGEQIDLLRRVLGLATDPPPCDAAVYWSIEWMAALLAERPATWDAALQHHPGLRLLDDGGVVAAEDALDLLEGFHRVCTWTRLRLLTSELAFRAPDLRAEDAAWLDDGAFARFVLSRCPAIAALRARMHRELPGGVGDRVLATLDQLGVPAVAWPDEVGHRAA